MLFTNRTGKFKDSVINIQYDKDAVPEVQAPRKIPLHYLGPLKEELKLMVEDDIIKGPLSVEDEGSFISNLVVKGWVQ